ncbi:hypothetical protein KZZ05_20415, partial [Marinobacter adhaerens]|uniref:hypothetical protein n=1 Tax=Marinobacter adhaerens TaxID=1033846 RepID=UPI001C5E2C94
SVAAFAWNGWQASSGISGNLGLEYAGISFNATQCNISVALVQLNGRWRIDSQLDEFIDTAHIFAVGPKELAYFIDILCPNTLNGGQGSRC